MTTMNFLIAFAAGAVLGTLYFAMLWIAVQRFTHGGQTWIFAVTTLARVALILAAMAWFVMGGYSLYVLAAAAAGFLVARFTATRLVKQKPQET